MHEVQFKAGKGYPKLLKGLKKLPQHDVLVGIPADRGARQEGTITNAQLGYIHEFGAPEVGIPARPSLFPGIRDVKDSIAKHLGNALKAQLNGKLGLMDKELNAAGMIAMAAVQGRIKRGEGFAPLKASTIRRRRKRSKGSSYRREAQTQAQVTPLIDTGQFLRSFTYVVRHK